MNADNLQANNCEVPSVGSNKIKVQGSIHNQQSNKQLHFTHIQIKFFVEADNVTI